jgi:hypothetical protein
VRDFYFLFEATVTGHKGITLNLVPESCPGWLSVYPSTSGSMTQESLIVLLPGFKKGRDIKASQGKGQGAVLAKKGQFASYKEKLEKRTEFHSF